MSQAEWNKKEELVAEQALKHLKQYTLLLEAFTTTARSELALMLKVQEFCYGNMIFMKVFQKIILLFYKSKFIITYLTPLALKLYLNNFFFFFLKLMCCQKRLLSSGTRRIIHPKGRCYF